MRRRASVLVVTLVSVSLLLGLAALEFLGSNRLSDDTVDLMLSQRVDLAARDMLERVTVWLYREKPDGAFGGSDSAKLGDYASPDMLEGDLTASLASSEVDGVRLVSKIFWCIYEPPSLLDASCDAEDYPPAVGKLLDARQSRVFSQTYESVSDGAAYVPEIASAWLVTVEASPASDEDGDFRSVTLSRLVAFSR